MQVLLTRHLYPGNVYRFNGRSFYALSMAKTLGTPIKNKHSPAFAIKIKQPSLSRLA